MSEASSGLPHTIGRYQIVGRLATGGMAELFLAKLMGPSGFERPVVVKRILPHLARDPAFRGMFLDEARIAAGIRSPNVVQVNELGQDGEDLFLVMEYLSGETTSGLMRSLVSEGRTLSPALAAYILAEACAGAHAAHESVDADGGPVGLVHRDISPDNLFVTYSGDIKLLDFGIAQAAGRLTHTQTGQLKGKFSYMSPEQCRGEDLDLRSDIFSLGVVLWELSVGKRLFRRKNELLTMKAICDEPTPAPDGFRADYPSELVPICLRALAKQPADRYASAWQMRVELEAAIRKMAPELDAADRLRALMLGTFAERIDEKSAMLRAVRDGAELVSIPPQEAVAVESKPTSIQSRLRRVPAAAPRHRRRLGYLALVALCAAGVGFAWRRSRSLPSIAPPPPVSPVSSPQIAVDAAVRPPAAAAREVAISIESTPRGASVLVDGETRCETPCVVRLPQGTSSRTVELRRPGWQTLVEQVTPEVDQKLKLSMAAIAKPASKRKPTERGFKRFE